MCDWGWGEHATYAWTLIYYRNSYYDFCFFGTKILFIMWKNKMSTGEWESTSDGLGPLYIFKQSCVLVIQQFLLCRGRKSCDHPLCLVKAFRTRALNFYSFLSPGPSWQFASTLLERPCPASSLIFFMINHHLISLRYIISSYVE